MTILTEEGRRFGVRVPLGRLRKTALRLAILEWDEWASERLLRRRVAARFRQAVKDEGYGTPILMFILGAVIGEIIAWAVGRLLDWWWDRHHHNAGEWYGDEADEARTSQIYQWQQRLRAD